MLSLLTSAIRNNLTVIQGKGNQLSKQTGTHPLSEGHCTQTGSQELHDEFTSATTWPITSLFHMGGSVPTVCQLGLLFTATSKLKIANLDESQVTTM